MTTPSPTPALPPPPGETSDFSNPPSLVRANDIAIGVAVPLATMFFFLRVYVRIWVKRTWIFEDWLALTAWVGTIALAVVGAVTMAHNGGKHEWDLDPAQVREASYWFNVTTINYGVTICIAKLAVLCYYRRVFYPLRHNPYDIGILCLIVLLILFYTATTIVKIVECVPRAKIFDPSIPGTCINTPMLLDVSGLFNTVTDVIVLCLPVKAVWNMNLRLKKKMIVVMVFTFGLCAPVFSLIGFTVRLQGNRNPDKTWVQPNIIMWGLAEVTTGVLCVSFPELAPLLKRKRHGPSNSIVNGQYLHGGRMPQKQTGHSLSTVVSHGIGQLESGAYIELADRSLHDIGSTARNGDSATNQQQRLGGILITQEVRIES
ncbi:hypothetical protein F5Y13DRAFT_203186 [Hypoxylon sp. FL1857]|nr:hypothetical protein F5Y13DRAFT_203186 [Hypoxylon sp. FL1857]